MTDLTSLVLTLVPPQPTTAPAHLGRAAYALLLQLIDQVDSELAQSIHNSDGPKPLTCSALIGGKRLDRNSRLYTPDNPAWMRFTGLNAAVSTILQQLTAAPPAAVELDNLPFTVQSATLDGENHPWAGQNSYELLAAPYLLAHRPPDFRLGLQFASPTTFRSSGRSQPIPMPGWVFGSLVDRWNAFSQVQIPQETRRFAEECLVLSHYRLKTRAIPMKAGVIQMGCVGQARYAVLNRDKYWTGLLNFLTEYSFYSGIGYQTTTGLGQARPLESSKPQENEN